MKYSLPCSVPHLKRLRGLDDLDNQLRDADLDTETVDDSRIIETLWVLNNEMTPSTLNELMISINLFCRAHNLTTRDDNASDTCHLTISGSVGDYSKAFNTSISKYNGDGTAEYHQCDTETLDIPYEWQDKVMCIMGFDNYPRFHTYHTILKRLETTKTRNPRGLAPNGSDYFDPLQLATLYNFPTNSNGLNGAGQKVGIIELGGGYVMSDIRNYFSRLGLLSIPSIVSINVDGAFNNPSDESGANVEVILDIEIVAAIVPGAIINVYFAPNTDTGFYNAIKKAIDDNCNTISISWGLAEIYWPTSVLTSYDNLFKTAVAKGITITAASGDNGSKDGTTVTTVDFPSSSPNVLGCGGTRLVANSNKTLITSEVVWNNNSTTSATGGGVSKYFSRPVYQNSVGYLSNKKRGVPDICAVADPNTGYVIYSESEGGLIVVGGTSAVAPLMAGLYARINQSVGGNVGFLNTHLYPHPEVCRDITQGNNGGYTASTGWDACTGLGSPHGTQMLSTISAILNPPAPAPEPEPTPEPTPEPAPPSSVSFTANRTYGKAPLRVNFLNTTPTVTRFRWDFGDGTNSTVKNPIKTYTRPGTYTVILMAFDKQGRPSKLTKPNLIVIKGKR